MRAFIAIDLPAELKDKIASFQAELKKADVFKGKFVEKENLHLALKFIGEISDKDMAKISKSLEGLSKKHKGFVLSLKGIGAFPSKDYIRVIWIGVDKGGSEAKALHDDINKALKSKESREFVGHLTLARVKAVLDKKKLTEFLDENKEFGSFAVKSIKLMKSELTKQGPKYETIKVFALAD